MRWQGLDNERLSVTLRCMKKSMSIRWDEELLERVDEARGDVPRARWIQRAIEEKLERDAEESPDES